MHQSHINVSQGSETSENIQSLAAGQFPPSLLSLIVIKMRLDAKLIVQDT